MTVAAGVLAALIGISSLGAGDQPIAELPLTTQDARVSECSFGDLVADALASQCGVGIAFVPAVALRPGTIRPGPFGQDDVNRLLQDPAEKWAVSRLKGAQIRAALERSVSWLPAPSGALLQVAGLVVTFDPKGPRGHRIKQILVSGQPLNDGREYEVAMPLSLAKGGSGYFTIFDARNIVRQGEPGIGTIVYEFAKARGKVRYTGQGRIVPSPSR